MNLIDKINASGDPDEWRKLASEGEKIMGTLLDISERARCYDGVPVVSRSTGRPRTEWVAVIRESAGRTVKVAANESMQEAFRVAVDQGGLLSIGCELSIEVTVAAPDMGQAKYAVRIGSQPPASPEPGVIQ